MPFLATRTFEISSLYFLTRHDACHRYEIYPLSNLASHIQGVFTMYWQDRATARNFKHQTPNFNQTTRAANPGAKLHPMVCCCIQFFVRDPNMRPTMWEPTLFVRDYNITPRQRQAPRFSCETTVLGLDNVRPLALRARLQISSPDNQTPHFPYETTISGLDNVKSQVLVGQLIA